MTIRTASVRWLLVAACAATAVACASPRRPTPAPAPGPSPTQTVPGDVGPQGPAGPGGETVTSDLGALPASGPGSRQDFVVNVGDRIYFETDSYEVRGDARPILDAQAAWLTRYPSVQVLIEGNADERGTREYNLALGARRASSVRDYLISRGVAASRIETVSYGKERPIDPGSDEQAWARNRNAHTELTGTR